MDKLDKKAEDTANEYKAEAASYMTFNLTNLEGAQHTVKTPSDGAVTGSASFKFAEPLKSAMDLRFVKVLVDAEWIEDYKGSAEDSLQGKSAVRIIADEVDGCFIVETNNINPAALCKPAVAQLGSVGAEPLPGPMERLFSAAESIRLSNGGAELEEMQPERLHELLGKAPALSIPQSFIDANNRPGAGWSGNVQPVPEQPTYPSWAKPGDVKASAPAWYSYEQQKAVTAPPVGCEVIVLEKPGLLVMQEACKFFNKMSRVVHCFKNSGDIQLVVVEHEDGICCCFVLDMIVPVDYDKPTFNKFYKDTTKALGFPPDNLHADFLLKLYKAGFKAPEQSE